MTQLRKWLFAALAALVLAIPLVGAASARADRLFPADPHGRVSARMWTTYEVHVHYYRSATGQTWDVGSTFNFFRDRFGNVVRTDGYNEFLAGIAAMNAQGWNNDAWQSYPIASGTW